MIEFNEETHEYFSDGKKLISVTQLMKKHGLAPDYSAVDAELLRKKAEYGKLVHAELAAFIQSGELGFTSECETFANYCAACGIKPIASETVVFNDIAAGRLDFIYEQDGEVILADFKTGSRLYRDAVAWQLSLYKKLYGGHVDKLRAFHFEGIGLQVADIQEKPAAEVERLLQCERDGTSYVQSADISENLLAELADVETLIRRIEDEKKAAKAHSDELRAAIMAAMKESGVSGFESDRIKITYIAPCERTTVDAEKLKSELPDVYSQYIKTSSVKETLKITIKE